MKRQTGFPVWVCAFAMVWSALAKDKPPAPAEDVLRAIPPIVIAPPINKQEAETNKTSAGVAEEKIAKAGIPPVASATSGGTNGLRALQGMEFLSSRASDEHDALLDDGNYFLQLIYTHWFSIRMAVNASLYFQQDFVASNAAKVAKANQTPGVDQIIKADVIGMQLAPQFSPWTNGLFLRADLGGEMAWDADEGADDSFNWKSDAMIGYAATGSNSTCIAEIGYGLYEMLPDNEWRSIARFIYAYDLAGTGLAGRIHLCAEFNGIEHSGEEQTRINLAYEMDPDRLFAAFAGLFAASPAPRK